MRLAFAIAALALGCGSSHSSTTDADLGLLTQCLATADAGTCTAPDRPLCCPNAGPFPPTVRCSVVCQSDDDCTAATPHCSKPGPTAAGMCMAANQNCCWLCD